MFPGPSALDPCMELVYVARHCDDHTFRRDIPDAGAHVSAEPHAILCLTERPFRLDAAVHP